MGAEGVSRLAEGLNTNCRRRAVQARTAGPALAKQMVRALAFEHFAGSSALGSLGKRFVLSLRNGARARGWCSRDPRKSLPRGRQRDADPMKTEDAHGYSTEHHDR